MPPTTRAAARARTAAAGAALPHDLLAQVCSFLPPGDVLLTVLRVSKALAAAVAPRAADLRAEAQASAVGAWWNMSSAYKTFSIPLWALQEAWPELGIQQRARATARAAFHGDLATLRWALPQLDDGDLCCAAAAGGQLEALQYMRALGCAWSRFIPWGFDRDACQAAAQGGHLAVLQWVRAQEPPCPWDKRTCSEAAYGGHLAVLQWARAQEPPCPWDEGVCSFAASGGFLAVLQWWRAQQPPCPWDDSACGAAAKTGRLAMLQWLRAQQPPCPWSVVTCSAAAEEGQLVVLEWLRAQQPPCPWDEETCWAAAERGHLAVLQWARAQEPPCPWDADECLPRAALAPAFAADDATKEWIRAQAALAGVAL